MKKIIVIVSFLVAAVFLHFALSTKTEVDNLKDECSSLDSSNLDMEQKIMNKETLVKHNPVPLSYEYSLVMNQIRILESYSGTNINVQLEDTKDASDVSSQFVPTEYKGVKGLKIKIVIDKFSKETDMGAVLDDIHLLERHTDFVTTQITKDNNNLIVKGEVYGI